MQRLWHRLNRVPGRTQCIYCNIVSTQSLRPKWMPSILPLEIYRFYDANSLFNMDAHARRSSMEEKTVLQKHKPSLMAEFIRSLATQDMDRIWPLYTYFYHHDLLHHVTRKNYHNLFRYTVRSRASQKNLHRLTALVEDMKVRGFSLRLGEYNALIDWIGGKTVPQRHPHHLTEALKIFEEMQLDYRLTANGEKVPKDPVQPSVTTFNTLIHIAAQLSDLRTAQKLYHDMLSRGLKPDKFTYCTLLHVMGRLGDVNGMDTMLKEVKQNGLNQVMSSTAIWNVVMTGYAANGLKERAYAMFDQMLRTNVKQRKKHKIIPKADADTFRIYIDLLLRDGKRNKAIAALHQMQHVGVRPTVAIYNALFGSFMTQEVVEEDMTKREAIHKLYQQMKENQVKPNSETMYTLVSAFLDLGDTKSALEVFVSLSEKKDKATDDRNIQKCSVSFLTKLPGDIKSEPLKIEPRPELLERLNRIVTKTSM